MSRWVARGRGSARAVVRAVLGGGVLWIAAAFVPIAHAASTSVTLQPQAYVANPGDHFNVDVVLTSDVPTRGVQFGLRFDPTVVQIDKVADGTYYQSWAQSNGAQASTVVAFKPDNTAGTVSVGGIAVLGGAGGGPTGSGTVVTLQMTAKSVVGATFLAYTSLIVTDAQSTKVPAVMGTPGIVGVGVDPSTLPGTTTYQYIPPATNSVSVNADDNSVGGARVSVPTPDPIQSGVLPASASSAPASVPPVVASSAGSSPTSPPASSPTQAPADPGAQAQPTATTAPTPVPVSQAPPTPQAPVPVQVPATQSQASVTQAETATTDPPASQGTGAQAQGAVAQGQATGGQGQATGNQANGTQGTSDQGTGAQGQTAGVQGTGVQVGSGQGQGGQNQGAFAQGQTAGIQGTGGQGGAGQGGAGQGGSVQGQVGVGQSQTTSGVAGAQVQSGGQPAGAPTTPGAVAARPLQAAHPVVKPRGAAGIFIPWEWLAGLGGGIVGTGIVLLALRRHSAGPGVS